MSVRITIECDDYYVTESLSMLSAKIVNTNILRPVYSKGQTKNYKGSHCKAKIEYVKDRE
jgi:hypothetical protein